MYNLGGSLNFKVDHIIHQGDWRWPRPKNRVTQSIISQTTTTFKPDRDKEVSITWLPHPNGCYSVKSAWEVVRKSSLSSNGQG